MAFWHKLPSENGIAGKRLFGLDHIRWIRGCCFGGFGIVHNNIISRNANYGKLIFGCSVNFQSGLNLLDNFFWIFFFSQWPGTSRFFDRSLAWTLGQVDVHWFLNLLRCRRFLDSWLCGSLGWSLGLARFA